MTGEVVFNGESLSAHATGEWLLAAVHDHNVLLQLRLPDKPLSADTLSIPSILLSVHPSVSIPFINLVAPLCAYPSVDDNKLSFIWVILQNYAYVYIQQMCFKIFVSGCMCVTIHRNNFLYCFLCKFNNKKVSTTGFRSFNLWIARRGPYPLGHWDNMTLVDICF